jgi:hypothetical protein
MKNFIVKDFMKIPSIDNQINSFGFTLINDEEKIFVADVKNGKILNVMFRNSDPRNYKGILVNGNFVDNPSPEEMKEYISLINEIENNIKLLQEEV